MLKGELRLSGTHSDELSKAISQQKTSSRHSIFYRSLIRRNKKKSLTQLTVPDLDDEALSAY